MTRRRSHARASRFSCVAVVAIHQKVPRSIDRGSGQISGSVFLIALTPAWMAARVFPMIRSRSTCFGVIYSSRKYFLHTSYIVFSARTGSIPTPEGSLPLAKDPNRITKSLSLWPAYFWVSPPLLGTRASVAPPSISIKGGEQCTIRFRWTIITVTSLPG